MAQKIILEVVSWKYIAMNLLAYDEKGNEKTIKFTANKQLKKGALLRLYVKKENEVTAWEEVSIEKVAAKAKEKMNIR